ncbi:MAG: homocysteine S-methyltransferase family protein [Thaumarchaeota archaeon]|nr:homocysteine S-methyltransferase family protein [Nitrososphaerota archaeon]MCY3976025.1 homocysteine S-methyltransferase family protein [Nitrososphaerota archaeon]
MTLCDINIMDALENQILLLDGAIGTELQKFHPCKEDYLDNSEGFSDSLSITKPQWISQIHRNYLKAGANCIETNTFSSNTIKLQEFGYEGKTELFNEKISKIAVDICSEFSDLPRYVLGSMGPTGFLPSSTDPELGKKSLEEIKNAFEAQAIGLIRGGVDALLIETSQDILEVKLAVEASHDAMCKMNTKIPIFANITLDQYGRMLLGTNIQAAYTIISGMDIDVFGLNCSTGPSEMFSSVQWLNENSKHKLLIAPNAGMPKNKDGDAFYDLSPSEMQSDMKNMISKCNQIRITGGCCGTTPDHIKLLRKIIDNNFR